MNFCLTEGGIGEEKKKETNVIANTEAAAKGDEQLTFRPDELKTWTECPRETQRAAGGRGQGLSGEAWAEDIHVGALGRGLVFKLKSLDETPRVWAWTQ